MRAFAIMLVASVLATPATAGINSFSLSLVDNSAGGAALANFVTTDVKINFNGQYTGAQTLIQLTSGSIYQDAFGNIVPPSPAFIPVFPSLAFDTFVAQGSATRGGPHGEPSVGGGAVDLGGAAMAAFNTTTINQAWNPAGGVTITDESNFTIMRLTLSKDASGTARFLASAQGQPVEVRACVSFGALTAHGCGPDLEIVDASVTATVPDVVSHTFATTDDAPGELFWSDFTFAGPGKAVSGAADPTFDQLTQKFIWPTAGWKGGDYTATVRVMDPGELIDTGTLTIHLTIPEPGSVALVGWSLIALFLSRERRSSRQSQC